MRGQVFHPTAVRRSPDQASAAMGGIQGVLFIGFMCAMYDWLVKSIKPIAKYSKWWRENEKVCCVCGSTSHMCLDCTELDNPKSPFNRTDNYSVPPNPSNFAARKTAKYYFWRNMSAFRPENRPARVGGIDDAVDVRSALHDDQATIKNRVLAQQPNKLPTKLANIPDSEPQPRPFTLEKVMNVSCTDSRRQGNDTINANNGRGKPTTIRGQQQWYSP